MQERVQDDVRRLREKERGAHTRRLVILGGELVRLSRGGDAEARRIIEGKLAHLAPGEKPVFTAWLAQRDTPQATWLDPKARDVQPIAVLRPPAPTTTAADN